MKTTTAKEKKTKVTNKNVLIKFVRGQECVIAEISAKCNEMNKQFLWIMTYRFVFIEFDMP